MAVDTDRLNAFLGRFVSDLGATVAAGGVVVGHRLGLYRALADGPADAEELAGRTGTHPRYVAEWLRGQAAGGYVEYDAATGAFSLTEEQAFALTDPEGPLYVPGAFLLALGTLRAEPQITDAFRTGAGIGWHEHARRRARRLRDVLPPRLPRQPRPELDPGAGRRRGEAERGRRGGRRRLRARRLDRAAGPGLPAFAVRRLGLPRRVGRAGPQARRRGGRGRPGELRSRVARRTSPGRGYDLVDDVRLPARHGRPGWAPPGTSASRSPRTGPG